MHIRVRPNSTAERLVYEIRRDSLRRLVTCTFLFPFGTSQGSEDNSIPHHINRTREFSHYYSFINLAQRKPLNRMPRAKSQEPIFLCAMRYFQEGVVELRSPLSLEKPQYVCRAGEFQPGCLSQPE